jgi:hypothetical protein
MKSNPAINNLPPRFGRLPCPVCGFECIRLDRPKRSWRQRWKSWLTLGGCGASPSIELELLGWVWTGPPVAPSVPFGRPPLRLFRINPKVKKCTLDRP